MYVNTRTLSLSLSHALSPSLSLSLTLSTKQLLLQKQQVLRKSATDHQSDDIDVDQVLAETERAYMLLLLKQSINESLEHLRGTEREVQMLKMHAQREAQMKEQEKHKSKNNNNNNNNDYNRRQNRRTKPRKPKIFRIDRTMVLFLSCFLCVI